MRLEHVNGSCDLLQYESALTGGITHFVNGYDFIDSKIINE